MHEKALDFLIWLFRIDESRSYEEQPQWMLVLFIGMFFTPMAIPLWAGLVLAVLGYWLLHV